MNRNSNTCGPPKVSVKSNNRVKLSSFSHDNYRSVTSCIYKPLSVTPGSPGSRSSIQVPDTQPLNDTCTDVLNPCNLTLRLTSQLATKRMCSPLLMHGSLLHKLYFQSIQTSHKNNQLSKNRNLFSNSKVWYNRLSVILGQNRGYVLHEALCTN